MQVFNRHVSASRSHGLRVRDGAHLRRDPAGGAGARLARRRRPAACGKSCSITALCELCFYYNDLYDLTRRPLEDANWPSACCRAPARRRSCWPSCRCSLPSLLIGSGTFLDGARLLLVAVPVWRLAFDGVTQRSASRGARSDRRHRPAGAHRRASRSARSTISPIGSSGSSTMPHTSGDIAVAPVVGTPADLPQIIRRTTSTASSSACPIGAASCRSSELLQAKLSGVRVEDAATTYERITGKILVDDLKPSWLIFSDGFRASRLTRAIKRAVRPRAGRSSGWSLAAPLMLLTALASGSTRPGPILYRQERVGENGRIVHAVQVPLDAHRRREAARRSGRQSGDDRVTRVGRFIRLTRLDELPQLWNVLRGDMSFVGPRPERPFFVEQLAAAIPFYMAAPRGEARRHRLGAGEIPLRLVDRGRAREAALRPLLHQASVARVRPHDPHRHGQGDPVRERARK